MWAGPGRPDDGDLADPRGDKRVGHLAARFQIPLINPRCASAVIVELHTSPKKSVLNWIDSLSHYDESQSKKPRVDDNVHCYSGKLRPLYVKLRPLYVKLRPSM